MSEKILTKRNIPQTMLDNILGVVKSTPSSHRRPKFVRQTIRCENLMLRTYLDRPLLHYSSCRKAIQPDFNNLELTDLYIAKHAETLKMSDKNERQIISRWAYEIVSDLYEGMAGNSKLFETTRARIEKPCLRTLTEPHIAQERAILFGLFEWIPELAGAEERSALLSIGKDHCRICLSKILDNISFDLNQKAASEEIGTSMSTEALIRELYLAKRELREYRELVEASEAEFENKLDELKSREFSEFFSALNNEKYGYMIDSVYLLVKACAEIKKSGIGLPYAVSGVPAFLERFLQFLRDSGISPASKFPPHSTQYLTLAQMDGCRFEPHPDRSKPLAKNDTVKVKVMSSGWKYGDAIISYPVLQEET